jgi:type IV pilus assembly protein PilW
MDEIIKTSNGAASQKGFTIVELLVAMAISLVVMGAIYSTYRSQQASYIVQDQVAKTQQNLRAAMYTLVRDIQMAGYDKTNLSTTKRNIFGITTAGRDTITFTADNGDGANKGNGALETDEKITYSLNVTDPKNKKLIRTVGEGAGANDQTLAEHIEAIGFAYAYDSNGDDALDLSPSGQILWAIDSAGSGALNQRLDTDDNGVIDVNDDTDNNLTIDGVALTSPVNITSIKSVKVWLLAGTPNAIQGYNVSNRYVVGNKVISPDPTHMYRLLSETIKCRNR